MICYAMVGREVHHSIIGIFIKHWLLHIFFFYLYFLMAKKRDGVARHEKMTCKCNIIIAKLVRGHNFKADTHSASNLKW